LKTNILTWESAPRGHYLEQQPDSRGATNGKKPSPNDE
jgi:hypothetical protein